MFKLIKDGELKFAEKPETTKEAKDFIFKVIFTLSNILSV